MASFSASLGEIAASKTLGVLSESLGDVALETEEGHERAFGKVGLKKIVKGRRRTRTRGSK